MKFSIMFWQKPGLAWVKLNDDEQWRLVARADFDPENYHELSRLTGLLRKGNYEKKDLDSALKFIYSNFSWYEKRPIRNHWKAPQRGKQVLDQRRNVRLEWALRYHRGSGGRHPQGRLTVSACDDSFRPNEKPHEIIMTKEEAIEIVLEAAEHSADILAPQNDRKEKILEAVLKTRTHLNFLRTKLLMEEE